MSFRFGDVRFGLAATLLALLSLSFHVSAELTAKQSRGKQIYFEGTSPSGGEITAVVGNEAVTLPASAAPCASCHGSDGLGRPEGGVIPPDIRWSELTKVYGHVHETGRKHGPFDHSSLARVIRAGLDPDHNRLDKSMPLYSMSVKDMRSLIAYLEYLEYDLDPGLSEETIRVGTLLPFMGSLGKLGSAMAQVMHAQIKEINNRGGIFGRKLELLAIPYGVTPDDTIEKLRSAFKDEGVFALVGAYTIGMDEPLLELLGEEKMPMVGPFTLNPGDAFTNSDIFYLYSGFAEQAMALVDQASKKSHDGNVNLVLVGSEGEQIEELIDAVRGMQGQAKKNIRETLRYDRSEFDADKLAAELKKLGSEAVLFLGVQGELEALLKALDGIQHSPSIFALSAFIPRPLFEAPQTFNEKIFLAYPTLSSDITDDGRTEYVRLQTSHALPRGNLQSQIAALAAMKVLEEGLRGAGRILNRERLVDAIEALYRYDTGLTPPLTYGPNRRIGAMGAHVLKVDMEQKTNTAVGGWHEVK